MDVQLDLYPASVTTGETTYSKARAIVADGKMHVIVDHGADGPSVVESVDVTGEPERLRGRAYTVPLADGSTWQVRKGQGCGCGATLKKLTVDGAFTLINGDG